MNREGNKGRSQEGVRNFVTGSGHTTTLGSCSTAVCNPTTSTSTNRISSSGYTFDANGNLTVDATGQRFVYDAENHQTAFFVGTNSGSTPDATYTYDGTGNRIKKISSTETTVFVYDGGGEMVAEYSTALASTQQVSYMTEDHLGSPRVITNENGAVTNRKDYMAFGDQAVSIQRVSGSGGNKYDDPSTRTDYTGYEKDSESGLEFAQTRYYNSQHGRYTSVDPMIASATIKNPQTFNRYS
jgi:RHS repeat-associated protein